MRRKEMKSALGASLEAEASSFRSRLARAEQVLGGERSGDRTGSVGQEEAHGEAREAEARVVRGAFTMPADEHAQIEVIRVRALGRAVAASKSEILRAGLLLLAELAEKDEDDLVTLLQRVEKVRTGRPKAKVMGAA